MERLGLVDRFSARDHHLHIQGFYEGIVDSAIIGVELSKVRRLLKT